VTGAVVHTPTDPHRPEGGPDRGADPRSRRSVLDLPTTARRLRSSLLVVGALVLVLWVAAAVREGWPAFGRLGELVGFGLLAAFVIELVVVGGAALRGMLRAGERGERLSSDDVGLIPPQLRRRRPD
jgi:hypothetical protein